MTWMAVKRERERWEWEELSERMGRRWASERKREREKERERERERKEKNWVAKRPQGNSFALSAPSACVTDRWYFLLLFFPVIRWDACDWFSLFFSLSLSLSAASDLRSTFFLSLSLSLSLSLHFSPLFPGSRSGTQLSKSRFGHQSTTQSSWLWTVWRCKLFRS